MRKLALTSLALWVCLATACIDYLEPGDFGKPRYVDNMRGATPMRLVPPITDREGNAYVLYGSPDFTGTVARVGYVSGGWKKGCNGHRGDGYGLHGWVGRGEDRAWYWSGEALVEVSAHGTGCGIVTRDAETRAGFRYLAVFPAVKSSPSRTSVVALVAVEGDTKSYFIVVDLLRGLYKSARVFEPDEMTQLTVLGVGAAEGSRLGFVIVRYIIAGETVVEGRYVDDSGRVLARAPLSGMEEMEAYSVAGYLQSVDGRRVVGVLSSGDLVIFDPSGGGVIKGPDGMQVVGVHRADDRLFLVGTAGDQPVLAELDVNGNPMEIKPWAASLAAHDALHQRRIRVLDDRGKPTIDTVWAEATTAIGPFPFVSPFTPEDYARGSTSWLVAGPTYRAGGDIMTAVAFLPMGISYP
jgi:hypothetical protein